MQIAIDGPAGSGKTSVARALAKRFGCLFINTGAMYRAVALGLMRRLKLSDIQIEIRPNEHIFLNGEDVTEHLYTPEIDELASQVAPAEIPMRFFPRNHSPFSSDTSSI